MSLLVAEALLICLGTWFLWSLFRDFFVKSSLDNIPGPPSDSFWTGNFRKMSHRHEGWGFHHEMAANYGAVAKIHGMLNERVLYIYDPKALHSIMVKDQHIYEKPNWLTILNNLVLGPGLLSMKGDAHRRQRKMLTPVFSIKHMRFMMPIFYQITHTLRDVFRGKVGDGPQEVDILHWMGRTALELIGQGGLGYSFDPLVEDVEDTFGEAIKGLVPAFSGLMLFRNFLPYVVKIGTPAFREWLVGLVPGQSMRETKRITDTLYAQSKDIIDSKKLVMESKDEAFLQQVGEGKDIMSILLRANMMASEEDKLPEEELLGQMSTLVFAAMDTTSNALSRTFHLLAQHQAAQDKLRAEIMSVDATGDIPYDHLVELPYLDAICRETLRLYAPIASLTRQAQKDIVLPLAWPIRGVDGRLINEIFVPRGTNVFTSILASNRNKNIWGEDALEWKPERWLSPLPKAVSDAHIPGVYSNLMTFSGGGRSCIGFKFSQLEMKVVLADLVKTFRFSLPKEEIVWNLGGIIYPSADRSSTTPSMPIRVELLGRTSSTSFTAN